MMTTREAGADPVPEHWRSGERTAALAAAIRDLAAAVDRLDRRVAAMADDVAVIRGIADAWRQAEGRASAPLPVGYVARGGGGR